MNALLCASLEGPLALRWAPVELADPAPGELRLRVHAASLNFGDVLLTRGRYQIRPALPFVPGMEVAGEILDTGTGATQFRAGDRVAAVLPQFGGFAEQLNVPEQHVFHIDPRLPWEVACCIPSVYGTAWHALHELAGLRASDTVLVLGAAGGVGDASVRLAHAHGARVIAVVSDEARADAARAAGADHVIESRGENLAQALKLLRETHGEPSVVVDPVGGAATESALRSLAWRGRYLVIGFAAGSIPALAANIVLLKSAAIYGVNFGGYAMRHPAAAIAIYDRLVGMLAEDRRLWPRITLNLPMHEGAQALARLESRSTHGKIVLTNAH